MRGDSGFIFNDYFETAKERACRLYPAELVEGHLLHVYEEGGQWHVWLNCEDVEFTGLCIGVGNTRDQAIAQAVEVLEAVTARLQGPPAIGVTDAT